MNAKKLFLIHLLNILIFISCKSESPTHLLTRLDKSWKDYILNSGKTIGYRPDIITPDNAEGTTLTLQSTVLYNFGIKCEDQDCTPITLYELIHKEDKKTINKLLKIVGVKEYNDPGVWEWQQVEGYIGVACSIYFITKEKRNDYCWYDCST
jgi:hypothetical protein